MGAFSNFITGKKKLKSPPVAAQDPPPVITNAIYSYAAGPDNLGVGVMNLALERSMIPMQMGYYADRYDIKKALAPLEGASQFPLAPAGVDIDLRANGVYLMGPGVILSPLTNPNTGTVSGTGNTQG